MFELTEQVNNVSGNKFYTNNTNSYIIHKMDKYLEDRGMAMLLNNDHNVFIGGSLPSFIFSAQLKNKEMNDNECEGKKSGDYLPHDIDVYTSNHNKSILNINMLMEYINISESNGCIINLSFKKCQIPSKIQFILAEVDNFCEDVLGNYDCDMVSIGYHPATHMFIAHEKFVNAIKNKFFTCYTSLERTDENRQKKLLLRAKQWYGFDLILDKTMNTNHLFDKSTYYDNVWINKDKKVKICDNIPILTYINSPKYLQMFHHMYRCVKCHKVCSEDLICTNCRYILENYSPKKTGVVTVFGGVNGFGGIISNTCKKLGYTVYRTSRTKNPEKNTLIFDLNTQMSNELLECIRLSNIIVFNATKTLDNDESIWNTTIDTFDENILMDRINTNVLGYAKIIKELLCFRKKQLDTHNLPKLKIIYVDANESKFDSKMIDGKHPELNIAKAGVKQLFYTSANAFTKLNMSILCYDPGWMSYHGVSIEKKRSNSAHLIPPVIASLGLLHFVETCDEICDKSVYDFIKLF